MFGKLLRIFIAFRLFNWMRGRRRSRWPAMGRRGWGGANYYDPLHGHGLAGLFGRRRRSFI
ncbi:MAG: hypothetical protein JF616_15825 [Fibrobacteres bacterium]|jgi:hypothetical protein|nr:hypothetical protein [Fibrobacterota bacterium]